MERTSRNTKQKELLRKEISDYASFFTAEDLFNKAKKQDSKLGIATVYRFLKEFSKEKTLHTFTCNRKALYSTSQQSHSHFTCEQCGKTTHIHVGSLDFLRHTIKGSICHFQIDVTGTCSSCLQKR